MKGSRKNCVEHLEQRSEIVVVLLQPEDAGAAIAVERLDDDVAVARAERVGSPADPRDQRRRHQFGKFGDEEFLRRIAHAGRIVDDERLGVDPLEQMRGGDVVHVEGRVLPQKDHIHFRKVGPYRLAE